MTDPEARHFVRIFQSIPFLPTDKIKSIVDKMQDYTRSSLTCQDCCEDSQEHDV